MADSLPAVRDPDNGERYAKRAVDRGRGAGHVGADCVGALVVACAWRSKGFLRMRPIQYVGRLPGGRVAGCSNTWRLPRSWQRHHNAGRWHLQLVDQVALAVPFALAVALVLVTGCEIMQDRKTLTCECVNADGGSAVCSVVRNETDRTITAP